jgi:hypothetical protein
VTPNNYLALKPHITISTTTIIVPSSTILVYLLSILILFIGYRFFTKNKPPWDLSMFFLGLSTILAGTSYQALGYELKCEGLDYCMFTSIFEISYMFFTAISITLLSIAFSRTYTKGLGSSLIQK